MPPLKLSQGRIRPSSLGAVSLAFIALPISANSAVNGCATLAFNTLHQHLGQVQQGSAVQQVSFNLQAGLLQPQLELLLQQQFAIEMVDWQVSPHFRWPADYRLQAPSWSELLERLLKPYQLAVTLYPNNSAMVRYDTAPRAGL
jgi:hypothetical protein